jgi:hypothetical protein
VLVPPTPRTRMGITGSNPNGSTRQHSSRGVTVEQLGLEPEPEPTPERMFAVARRMGHRMFHGAEKPVDIDYAAYCRDCGMAGSWADEEHTRISPESTFMTTWNKPCVKSG